MVASGGMLAVAAAAMTGAAGSLVNAGVGALVENKSLEEYGQSLGYSNLREYGTKLLKDAAIGAVVGAALATVLVFGPGLVKNSITKMVGQEAAEKSAKTAQQGIASESGTDTTRVGRWMSQDEYDKMFASGKVQMSGDNKVHVANPADINAFGKQAPKGSIYVEFDVPSNTISKGGADGWGIINGPGSLLDRLYKQKGLSRITEMPNATNISIEGRK